MSTSPLTGISRGSGHGAAGRVIAPPDESVKGRQSVPAARADLAETGPPAQSEVKAVPGQCDDTGTGGVFRTCVRSIDAELALPGTGPGHSSWSSGRTR